MNRFRDLTDAALVAAIDEFTYFAKKDRERVQRIIASNQDLLAQNAAHWARLIYEVKAEQARRENKP